MVYIKSVNKKELKVEVLGESYEKLLESIYHELGHAVFRAKHPIIGSVLRCIKLPFDYLADTKRCWGAYVYLLSMITISYFCSYGVLLDIPVLGWLANEGLAYLYGRKLKKMGRKIKDSTQLPYLF